MSWATKELEKVDLGDTRRNRRLVKIVEDLAGNPESSIPQASRDAAAIQAAYDFFNNPRVKAEAIATAHRKSTVESYPLIANFVTKLAKELNKVSGGKAQSLVKRGEEKKKWARISYKS